MGRKNILITECLNALQAEGLVLESNLSKDCKITGITFDSRDVMPGNLFVCKGKYFNEEYLTKAIEKGAVAYVSEQRYSTAVDIATIIVSDIRRAMPILAKEYYGDLSKEIKLIGITGTKGKSITTYFTKCILDSYIATFTDKQCAFYSGIDNYDGIEFEESHLTTPETFELYKHLNNAVETGIPYFVMEVSSQALKYHRTAGIKFETVAFLNIGYDHISDVEHPDFDDYFNSKLSIFNQANRACINMDSEHFEKVAEVGKVCQELISFSELCDNANVYARNIVSQNGNVEFELFVHGVDGYEDISGPISLATFGKINVRNALAAAAMAVSLKIPFKCIQDGLSKALVPGRMEVFYSKDREKMGIVDYAHNDLSYRTMLSAISEEFPDKKLILVFGSSGGKALNRRSELGTLAGRYCSHVVLTEDDAGKEDVTAICEEIASYLGPNCTYEIIADRSEAIQRALEQADENTIVIACGKGHEHYQNRGDHYVEIKSDVEVMRELI